MFKLKTNLLLLNIFIFNLLGLLFITNNYQVMGMGNKNSNNNEISNDEEYVLYINEEIVIQNELANFKINDEKKDELLKKQKCITKAINKYNKRKNNNQLSTTYVDQPESSRRNISSDDSIQLSTTYVDQPESSRRNINLKIEKESDLSDDSIEFVNLIKNNSNTNLIDKPESSKKNDYKNKRRFN